MSDVNSTSSIGEACVTLRDDICFRPQQYAGQSCYVIEDPASSSFYRIGVAEYTLISLFDGRHTIRDAMHCASSVLGRDAFTEHDAAAITRWLVESGLAKTYTSAESKRLHKQSSDKQTQERRQWMNPLITKIPMFSPERILDRVAPALMWLTSWPMFCLWLLTMMLAGHQLVTHWNELQFDTASILSPNNWLWLGVVWLSLKFIHETFHAIACRKYAGEVREAGVVLIALAPIFYVDVTSSWRFPSKWQRIFVAAAGMYAEILIGAIAAIVWIHAEPGTVKVVAFNVLLLSTVTTILFNANPLMRFDGYYILSDYLEIPNLGTQGQEYLSYVGRKYIYGVDLKFPFSSSSAAEAWTIRCYGVAAMFWRVLVTVGIGLMAATLFHGAGLALVLVAAVFYVCVPIYKNVKYFLFGQDHEQPRRLRCATLTFGAAAAMTFACLFAAWPFAVKAPAVVEYGTRGVVRSGADGFVQRIAVQPGQHVEANQLLAVLENVELATEVERLECELEACLTRIRIASTQDDVAAQQFEHERRRDLQLQLSERQSQLDRLEVRAPTSGMVVTDDLDMLQGTFLQEGAELLTIGDESKKEFVLSISQDDADLFHDQQGSYVSVRMRGGNRERLTMTLGRVRPGASTQIEHVALTAAGGGNLAVRPRTSSEERQQWEFVEPRMSGTITLPRETGERLRAGQLAMVRLSVSRSTLGEGIYRTAESWLRKKWRQIQNT